MNRSLCVLLWACAASVCLADIPPPPPRGTPVTLVIYSQEASAFSLRIPANLVHGGGSDGRLRGAAAGLLISLSIMVAGVLLVRWTRVRPARMAMAVAALILAGAGAIVADIAVPKRREIAAGANPLDPGTLTRLRSLLDSAKSLSGKVSVEIVPENEQLTLIVPGPEQPRVRWRPHQEQPK